MAATSGKIKENSKKPASKPASAKEITSDMPLSERDEVKQAEERTGKAAKKKLS